MDSERPRRLRSDKDMVAIPANVTFMKQQQLVDHPRKEKTIDVRAIPRPARHPLIFGTFNRLDSGVSFCVVSDHDPRPLHYLFGVRHPGAFTWDYVERGPDVWRVCVGRTAHAE
ncbi:DUF2249 domain-containing protein [Bradyrhizobium sp. DASA03030]